MSWCGVGGSVWCGWVGVVWVGRCGVGGWIGVDV